MNDIELRKGDSKESRGYYFGMDDRKKQIIRAGLIFGTICGFLWFVWPTPYEYTRKYPNILRVNRFTGILERSTDEGWKTNNQIKHEAELQAKADKQVEESVFEKIELVSWEVEEERFDSGYYTGLIQFKNGSDKVLDGGMLIVDFVDSDGEIIHTDAVNFWSVYPSRTFESNFIFERTGDSGAIADIKLKSFEHIRMED